MLVHLKTYRLTVITVWSRAQAGASSKYLKIFNMWVEGLRAEGGNAWRQENELDWYRLNEPIFSESMKVMTQWKCFDKSHYAKPEPVWLQRGLPQSMIISLRESIPGRWKQSHFFFSFLPSDYCLLFSKVRPLVPQLQRLIFKNDSPFLFFLPKMHTH